MERSSDPGAAASRIGAGVGNAGRRGRPSCARCGGKFYVERDLTPDGCVELGCISCGGRVYIDARHGGVAAALVRLGFPASARPPQGEPSDEPKPRGLAAYTDVLDNVFEWIERQPSPRERDQTAWRNRGSKWG